MATMTIRSEGLRNKATGIEAIYCNAWVTFEGKEFPEYVCSGLIVRTAEGSIISESTASHSGHNPSSTENDALIALHNTYHTLTTKLEQWETIKEQTFTKFEE